MKLITSIASIFAGLVLAVTPVQADTYTDPAGDGALVGVGGGILDILSVEVTHNATDLMFKINLAGNPVATDWGKYMIGIDSVPGGDPAGNGWARPIGMSSGMDFWAGSWVDSGNGAELYQYTGSWPFPPQNATWSANPANVGVSKDASSVTIKFNYAWLGLGPGSTFLFDVYTSGGGGSDGAIDALGIPSQTTPGQSVGDWSGYYNSDGNVDSYTIPEPAACILLGLGGLVLVGRVLRRAF